MASDAVGPVEGGSAARGHDRQGDDRGDRGKDHKARAGTGGTLKDGLIELQGDQVAVALEALTEAGYRPKQAGG